VATSIQVEGASAVILPGVNSSCPNGRIFLSYGSGYGATRMLSSSLQCFVTQSPNCSKGVSATSELENSLGGFKSFAEGR